MTDESFRTFYAETAKPLWSYLMRVSGRPGVADDLMQEAYLRLLESALPADATDAHRRNYLFRIATNLLHDHFRSRRFEELRDYASEERMRSQVETKRDIERAMNALKPRDRELLWLAYVEGHSHDAIAGILGFRPASIRALLLRARKRLMVALREMGWA